MLPIKTYTFCLLGKVCEVLSKKWQWDQCILPVKEMYRASKRKHRKKTQGKCIAPLKYSKTGKTRENVLRKEKTWKFIRRVKKAKHRKSMDMYQAGEK